MAMSKVAYTFQLTTITKVLGIHVSAKDNRKLWGLYFQQTQNQSGWGKVVEHNTWFDSESSGKFGLGFDTILRDPGMHLNWTTFLLLLSVAPFN